MPATEQSVVVNEFTIDLQQDVDYQFTVRFDKPTHPELHTDEPPPLGADSGPNPSRLLAAAVANCLSASLLFCARRAKVPVGPIRTTITTRIARNESGRLRIAGMSVVIDPGQRDGEAAHLQRCLSVFEDYCIVTQSVRSGIDVQVAVKQHDEPTSEA